MMRHLAAALLACLLAPEVNEWVKGMAPEDMVKNLRNVAIPGTGIPLSIVCHFKCVAVAFLLVGYPLAAIVSALNLHRGSVAKVATKFSEQLLCPQDWFSFWQLNCRLSEVALPGQYPGNPDKA